MPLRPAPLVSILLALPILAAPPPELFPDHPLNTWVKRSPREAKLVPKFGWEGSAAWDPYSRLWVHHAGHDGIPQGFITFTFDPATGDWRQRFPNTSPPGVCCVDGSNVFDTANRTFVRFPGGSLGHGYQWSRGVKLKESPVWLYDVAADRWTNMRPPPYADVSRTPDKIGGLNPSGAYDPVHQLALSFGGQGVSGGKANLHAYDAHSNILHLLKPAAKTDRWPSPRDGCGLAFDAKHEKLVLFGGQYSNDENTWLYDFRTNRWQSHALNPHPPAQKGKTYSTIPKMVYDGVNGIVLCIVWLDEERGHETWVLDLGKMQWTKANPAAEPEPSKSRTRNLDFSVADNLAILETWTPKGEPQVWTYRYTRQPGLAGAMIPPAPADVALETTAASARLTWAAVPGAAKYQVLRGSADLPWKVDFVPLGETTTPTFEDKTVEPARARTYVVKTVAADGQQSPPSLRVRTDPRVPAAPVVSVISRDQVELSWPRHPAADVVAYNVYRGTVVPRTVTKGTPGAWKDNDPEYASPVIVGVQDITDLRRLNDRPLADTAYTDAIDLAANPAAGYRYGVYAYVLRAVNRLGVESGPSPYALTIPAEPLHLLCRETPDGAELKWSPSPEKAIAGYHVYKLEGGVWGIKRLTESPLTTPTFLHKLDKKSLGQTTRYWVTALDPLGQEGQPSSPAWYNKSYKGFYDGDWHQ